MEQSPILRSIERVPGGLYMASMGKYGQARDVGAYSVMTFESGPFLKMVALGVADLSAFPWQTFAPAFPAISSRTQL